MMKLPTSQLQFQRDILDWWYIFLLPAIVIIHFTINESTNKLICVAYISTVPTLLAYRYKLNFCIFALTNATVVLLLSAIFEIEASDGVFLFIANSLGIIFLRSILPVYTRCFTFVEFTIIVQPSIYYLLQILKFNWFTLANHAVFISEQETSTVWLTCFSSLLVAVLIGKLYNNHTYRYFCYLIFMPAFLYGYLWCVLPNEPLIWLLQLIFGDKCRLQLFAFWFLVLLFTCLFAYHHTGTTTTVTRKTFHFAITCVYLLGIKYDIQFLDLSSKLILFLFLYIEIIRLNAIYLISDIIDEIFEHFRDEKDSGILTLTHIYLLIGCSLPLWLSSNLTQENQLLLASGVIAVGIGDSFASLGGFYLGAHKWPNTSKSYEGTFCFFVAQMFAMIMLHCSYNSSTLLPLHIGKFAVISTATSLAETFTSHVDNLIVPLIQYTLTMLIY